MRPPRNHTTELTASEARTTLTVQALQQAMVDHLNYSLGTSVRSASMRDIYTVLSYAVRDLLIERWRKTTEAHYAANPKFIYYLSAEYLPGKQLGQNLLYTNSTDLFRNALADYGLDLEDFLELDIEPGLGNGGLGRLAACFLDSLATLDLPAVGYGIRYEFGIFKQTFVDGRQVERPDEWALYGNPWEFPQPDDMVQVGFSGHTERYTDERDRRRTRWVPGTRVLGEPCITLVPGYGTGTVNILRLWRARATEEFDFQLFDLGDYARAVERKVFSENISKVLYPNDVTPQGRELRLQQQYFFVACSLKDIIRRFLLRNTDWNTFPDKVVIHLNDTHPVIAIPELLRILLDEYGLDWDRAWGIARRTFAYTCHTLLPEALERWPVELLRRLLPRHLEIIYDINRAHLDGVRSRYPGDQGREARMSLIEEGSERQVRMANLAAVGSFSVNGVAALHSRLLQEHTLRDFAELWPDKFQNKTNGVTPRRFLRLANPRLCELITSAIGDGWLRDLERLQELAPFAEDRTFRRAWREIKGKNKRGLADYLRKQSGVAVDPASMFDVMVKRLHEYKRQLLMLLHIISLYHRLRDEPAIELPPRTFLFGAKAAPGYAMAKRIIAVINHVARVINGDPAVQGRLRVVFPPNFNVTLGERIYPAADLSEQISLAGKEASGTGNMKFALNGALTIGTLDGANIEIRERVGAENFFLFGLTADEVFAVKGNGYDPQAAYRDCADLKRVIDSLASGEFSNGDAELLAPIVNALLRRDEYLLLADYRSYADCQARVSAAYRDQEQWTRMSILNAARCGFFSSDRTIREYCRDIWKATPVKVEWEG